MSSSDNRESSATNGLQISGLVSQLSSVNQLPFPDSEPLPGKTTRHLEYDSSPNVTEAVTDPGSARELSEYFTSPSITRVLPDINTGKLSFPPAEANTTALRQPIVIRGTIKKKPGATHPPKGRKWIISIVAMVLLLCITLGTALAASPLNGETSHVPNPIGLVANLVHNSNNSPSLIAQQATASRINWILGSLARERLPMDVWREYIWLDSFKQTYCALDYCVATRGGRRKLFRTCCNC